jgi:CheY-like chemotaxis protein
MLDLSSWKVLVIEDEIDLRGVLRLLLERHGVTVSTADSGESALELLQTMRPTLLLVDLGLPGMDGWELLRAIQADPALTDIPAVALTALHSVKTAQRALNAGFVAYFSKPINSRTFVKDLVDAIE